MKRVLVVYYSQTGQLRDIVDSMLAPLRRAPHIEVTRLELKPARPYPFPWPFWRFFNTFPETVHEAPEPIERPAIPSNVEFDLVVLAYQVWFLSPSQPTTAFLQSAEAARVLRGKPVITVIGCRNMWLMAQERIKARLAELGAQLIDNVVLTDRAHSAATFISTPMWMLTGRRGPFLGGRVPAAGIPRDEIARTARFGDAIAAQLPQRASDDVRPMLTGLSAVTINERLIASERIARRSFWLWGKLLRSIGDQASLPRRIVLGVYVLFLATLILTVVPITAVLKRLIAPLTRKRILQQRQYFAAPSGESTERLDQLV